MTARIPLTVIFLLLASNAGIFAQDTLQIDFNTFLNKALQNSGQVKYQQQDVELAENQVKQAKAQRILPNLSLTTQHGLVPGIESDVPGLPRDEYYLDPNLRNDWTNWAIFTKFQLSAVQPVFTWGAINKAIEAAR